MVYQSLQDHISDTETNGKVGCCIHQEEGTSLKKQMNKVEKEMRKKEKPKVNPKQVFGSAYNEPSKSKKKSPKKKK